MSYSSSLLSVLDQTRSFAGVWVLCLWLLLYGTSQSSSEDSRIPRLKNPVCSLQAHSVLYAHHSHWHYLCFLFQSRNLVSGSAISSSLVSKEPCLLHQWDAVVNQNSNCKGTDQSEPWIHPAPLHQPLVWTASFCRKPFPPGCAVSWSPAWPIPSCIRTTASHP